MGEARKRVVMDISLTFWLQNYRHCEFGTELVKMSQTAIFQLLHPLNELHYTKHMRCVWAARDLTFSQICRREDQDETANEGCSCCVEGGRCGIWQGGLIGVSLLIFCHVGR